ncbi:ABC transporter permease [Psychromicrobium xiongbiense]|uniref:ABC transporter permease n=1 Tax=Psychromicrobium xiongbiense TaxID=3051184 RepID=UPI0025563685|nr:ABC transporter permease [Psychromicrobium sp. YIM S02556]
MTTIPSSISLDRKAAPWGGFNLTLLRIELARRLRNRRTLIFALVMPIVMFLIFGLQFKNVALTSTPVAQGGLSVMSYIMISMAVYGCMITSTSAGGSVAVERAMGWSRQLRLTPLSPAANIATKVLGGLMLGLIAVLAVFLTGFVVGVRLDAQVWIVSGLAALGGSLVFTALGLLMGYLIPSENVMQFMGPLVAFLALFGGLFVPLNQLGDTFVQIGKWTPTYGLSELAHAPLLGATVDGWSVLNILAWLLIFSAGAALAFRRDTRRV